MAYPSSEDLEALRLEFLIVSHVVRESCWKLWFEENYEGFLYLLLKITLP